MRDPVQTAFQPAMRSSALKPGQVQAVRIGETGYALFRDANGDARCLLDRCAHRFAPLSAGRVTADGRLECGYHGWRFDGQGRGSSAGQPKLRGCRIDARAVGDHAGWLWVGGADASLSELPSFEGDGFRFIGSFESKAAAPLHVVLDNFSEDEHTPFVHGRLGWTPERAGEVEFKARCHEDRVEVEYVAPQRPSRLLPLVGVRNGDIFTNRWVTSFRPIQTTYTLSWHDPETRRRRPVELRYTMVFVPDGQEATRIVVFTEARVAHASAVLEPIVGRIGMALAWKEVFDDIRWVRHVKDTPKSFRGMHLGRFDPPLVHQRNVIRRLYGEPGERRVDVPADALRRRV